MSQFSAVKTDVNWFTNAVALLKSVAAGIMDGGCKVGILCWSLRRDLMYDQNGWGFSLRESPKMACRWALWLFLISSLHCFLSCWKECQ